MKDKLILKLKKRLAYDSKSIDLEDKAIEALKLTQDRIVEDFNTTVIATVKKSEARIAYHTDIIAQAEGMSL